MAEELRGRVRERTHVTCSCGVAPNRLLAKIASDINKPDGQYVLPGETDAVASFMARLPIRKVPGIGKVEPFPSRICRDWQGCAPAHPQGARRRQNAIPPHLR